MNQLQSGTHYRNITVGFKRLYGSYNVVKASKYEFILGYAFVRNCARQRRTKFLWKPCAWAAWCGGAGWFSLCTARILRQSLQQIPHICRQSLNGETADWALSQTNQTGGWENTGISKLLRVATPEGNLYCEQQLLCWLDTSNKESRIIRIKSK